MSGSSAGESCSSTTRLSRNLSDLEAEGPKHPASVVGFGSRRCAPRTSLLRPGLGVLASLGCSHRNYAGRIGEACSRLQSAIVEVEIGGKHQYCFIVTLISSPEITHARLETFRVDEW